MKKTGLWGDTWGPPMFVGDYLNSFQRKNLTKKQRILVPIMIEDMKGSKGLPLS
jgi:hypothetical protein